MCSRFDQPTPQFLSSHVSFALPLSTVFCTVVNFVRGEFSFFIAQEASDEGILETEEYSAVVWALLLSSVAAPLFFRRVLNTDDENGRRRKKGNEEEAAAPGHVDQAER